LLLCLVNKINLKNVQNMLKLHTEFSSSLPHIHLRCFFLTSTTNTTDFVVLHILIFPGSPIYSPYIKHII
jgi:hypothetical protein